MCYSIHGAARVAQIVVAQQPVVVAADHYNMTPRPRVDDVSEQRRPGLHRRQFLLVARFQYALGPPVDAAAALRRELVVLLEAQAVSYTHLTLPTICSV